MFMALLKIYKYEDREKVLSYQQKLKMKQKIEPKKLKWNKKVKSFIKAFKYISECERLVELYVKNK